MANFDVTNHVPHGACAPDMARDVSRWAGRSRSRAAEVVAGLWWRFGAAALVLFVACIVAWANDA